MNATMQPEDSTLLWKYIDGNCTPEEALQLEQRLAQDPALKAEWQQRLQLNSALRKLPLEQPSMRFAVNIMDRLPSLFGVRKINVKPLVSPRWLTAFWTAMGTVFCVVVASVTGGDASGVASSIPGEKIVEQWSALFQRLPYTYLLAGAAVVFGLLALHAIERRIEKPYEGPKHS